MAGCRVGLERVRTPSGESGAASAAAAYKRKRRNPRQVVQGAGLIPAVHDRQARDESEEEANPGRRSPGRRTHVHGVRRATIIAVACR